MPEQSNDYRVVVFGAGGVGKSSLVLRFVKGTFRDTYIPTIEDTYRQVISCDKSVCTLQITDTTGSHQFPAMQRLSISKGHGVEVRLHGDLGQDELQREGALPGAAEPGEEEERQPHHRREALQQAEEDRQNQGEVQHHVEPRTGPGPAPGSPSPPSKSGRRHRSWARPLARHAITVTAPGPRRPLALPAGTPGEPWGGRSSPRPGGCRGGTGVCGPGPARGGCACPTPRL
uniref:DIRAS family GTPase 1 n=1 Tax=Dromaius novaehollandiae TaxID=8790 RepID=A0A8C4JJH3_DRONO